MKRSISLSQVVGLLVVVWLTIPFADAKITHSKEAVINTIQRMV